MHSLKYDCFDLFPVCFLQLFRRVAAALPGMESTQDKSREDSILYASVLQFSGGKALPGITRKMQALNNKDEGGGSNISPAALSQLVDIPKRGLRGGVGASNLQA